MNIETLKGTESENQYTNLLFYRKGGMGEIYTATDSKTGEKKAIKIVPVENEDEFQLLRTEFEISKLLKHKNIIDTEYFDEFNHGGTRYIYSVMDFNKEGSLRDYLRSQSILLSPVRVFELIKDLAEGLEYAHKKVIHRDLKPENILLNNALKLQICDFGLAKLIDAKTRTRTYKGSGTLPYMAPECWMFDSNTVAMDIYSLGIIFYEIMTLQMPFKGRTEQEFKDKHLYEPLPNITIIRSDLPFRLIEMVNKMTNKRPSERYSSMTEIVQVLNDVSTSIEEKKDSKIESLLKKANEKISLTQQIELTRQKEQELIDTEQKFLDFSRNSLFDLFENRINELNASLERSKISLTRKQNIFSARFMGKSFTVSFYSSSNISEMIAKRKDTIIQNQIKQYGFVMMPASPSHVEKDNIILIGQMCLDTKTQYSEPWGYNLLLRKNSKDDLYGEWWVVWFDDSPIYRARTNSNHYAIKTPEFYQEYEFGRDNAMHVRSMKMTTLKSEGIDKIIEQILD